MTREDAERRALEILQTHVPTAELERAHQPPADFIGSLHGQRVLVVVKHSGAARTRDFIGLLATAALQLQSYDHNNAVPIVLIGTKRFGSRIESAMAEFADRYANRIGWGVFDDTGGVRLVVAKLGIDVSIDSKGAQPKTVDTTRLFSDLNRWIIKLLLLRESPPANFPAQHREPPRNPKHLSEIAGVSHETAYKCVRQLKRRNFLEQDSRSLKIVRAKTLLAEWVHEDRVRPTDRTPVRALFPGAFSLDGSLPSSHKDAIAIGGFEACSRLGLLHAPYSKPEVHVRGDLSQLLEALGVRVCEQRDADLFLIQSSFPESVFRSASILDRSPIVDAWQAALDVASNAARGSEQVEYITERMLRWIPK